MKFNEFFIFAFLLLVVIFISGCIQQESSQFGQIDGRNNKSNVVDKEQQELVSPEKDITQTKGLGNLCSCWLTVLFFAKAM